MAPRKTKTPTAGTAEEAPAAPKAAARPRGRKTAIAPPAQAAPAPEPLAAEPVAAEPVAAEPVAAEPVALEPARPAKARRGKGAKPKAGTEDREPGFAEAEPAAAAPAPVPEPVSAVGPEAVPGPPAESAPGLTERAQTVLQAIQTGRAVELLFVEADANPPRTFEPRQLIFDTFAQDWYVWGWDRRYNAERHHLLSLIAQVNPVEGIGRAAQGPFKEGTSPNLIGGWLGGEPIRVKAVLLKQWVFAVRQAPAPFPEFTIEEVEEGKAQVTFCATDLRAITRWVMQFGDGIQVLEPQRLLDRLKQVGLAWGGKAAQPPAPAPAPAPTKPAARAEHRAEHKEHRAEHRFEAKPEPVPERTKNQDPRSPKPAKPNRVEIRIDRL